MKWLKREKPIKHFPANSIDVIISYMEMWLAGEEKAGRHYSHLRDFLNIAKEENKEYKRLKYHA